MAAGVLASAGQALVRRPTGIDEIPQSRLFQKPIGNRRSVVKSLCDGFGMQLGLATSPSVHAA
jgi:hypothetical protein